MKAASIESVILPTPQKICIILGEEFIEYFFYDKCLPNVFSVLFMTVGG